MRPKKFVYQRDIIFFKFVDFILENPDILRPNISKINFGKVLTQSEYLRAIKYWKEIRKIIDIKIQFKDENHKEKYLTTKKDFVRRNIEKFI